MSSRMFVLTLLLAVAAAGCGGSSSKSKGKALVTDEKFASLETGINQARKTLSPYAMPDFALLEKLAGKYAEGVKGTPNEANANKLIDKLKEVHKLADDKAPYEEIKKGFGELDRFVAALRPQ